jgi:hypothetical protein
MGYLWLIILAAVMAGVGLWQLVVWLIESRAKSRQYEAACACAEAKGKPLLVAGGPWGVTRTRRRLNKPAHGNGDVCLDIDRRALGEHPCGVVANVTHIPFTDKCFGAVFASHLLEHLPNVEAASRALEELNRVADEVYLVYPSRQSLAGWAIPDHHLWVWQKNSTTYLRQRGKSGGKRAAEYYG